MPDRLVYLPLTADEVQALRDRLLYGGVVGERSANALAAAKVKIARSAAATESLDAPELDDRIHG